MRSIEKSIVLETIDTMWMNHLDEIDYLRDGIGLRGYGQRDPLIEYKREAFAMFSHLMENIRSTVVHTIFRVSLVVPQQLANSQKNLSYSGAEEVEQFSSSAKAPADKGAREIKSDPIVNENNVGRNDPCPCGSGKKYKRCCGA
jgi:preprotein translocase subunit SecA